MLRGCGSIYSRVVGGGRGSPRTACPVRRVCLTAASSSVGHYIEDAWGFGYNDLVLKNRKIGYCRKEGNYEFDNAQQVAGGRRFGYTDYEVFQLIHGTEPEE